MSGDLRLESVERIYGQGSASPIHALRDVTLQVESGALVAITGPSGSGKSTLLHIVGAMDQPNSGRVWVGDREVTALARKQQAEYRRTIGFVFQRIHLLPALTALDNVVAPVLPYRVGFDKREKAKLLLGAVNLGERAAALPSQLSGGEQQRVAIARALINDPVLLLADEPTGNLDSDTSVEIMELLLELRRVRGMTVIVATHDPVIATRCERMIRLIDGAVAEDLEITALESPEELLGRITRPGTEH